MKTMLRLAETRDGISVVSDQIGTPTYAGDLAEIIIQIINTKTEKYGIYHYSNEGVASWYEFAKEIFKLTENKIKVNPIPSIEYLTSAKRPKYSVLDKKKIIDVFKIDIPFWRESLKKVILQGTFQ
jgi:dTDP-4-dehydrorhamnose reductase